VKKQNFLYDLHAILRVERIMAKITIDTVPQRPVEYLNDLPHSIESNPFEANKVVFSALVQKPLIESELETLVGRFFSNSSFAAFSTPEKMDCPQTYSQSLIPNIDLHEVLEKLQTVESSSFLEQEEREQLEAFFLQLSDLEELYQKILANLRKLQKA
jgi:hypothetical protein